MAEKRRSIRTIPLPGEEWITVYGFRGGKRKTFGQATDESTGGLGILIEEPASFEIGDAVLIHRFRPSKLSLATVRHVQSSDAQTTVMGVQWFPS